MPKKKFGFPRDQHNDGELTDQGQALARKANRALERAESADKEFVKSVRAQERKAAKAVNGGE